LETNEQVVKLEKVIANQKTALDAVNEARTQLESQLNEANADNDLRKELDASQSQMKENQTHAQELTNELEKTKKEAYAQLTTEREASQRRFGTITDETTKKLSESEKRIANLTEQLKSVSAERDATQSKFSENQSQLEAMQNELAKAQEATQQANAKATELETAANAATDAEAERSKLQAALDQATVEIERLKGELEKQKSTPPEQGESVSPAPGERRL